MKPDVEDLYLHSTLHALQGSPSHGTAVFNRSRALRERDGYRAVAWCVDTAGNAAARALTSAESSTRSPRLSPDGATLAFLARRQRGSSSQVYLLPMAGGEAHRLTSFEHALASIHGWSPDGTALLVSASVAWKEDEHDDASLPRGKRPLVVNHLPYKMDGTGPTVGARTHVFRICVASGESTQLTQGDFDVRQARWSPDGKRLAFVRTRARSTRENSLRHLADLWIASADGADACRATHTFAAVSNLQWSPDSTRMVFGGNHTPGDPLDRPFLMQLEDATLAALGSDDLQLAGGPFVWHEDGVRIATVVLVRGMQEICVIDSAHNRVKHFPRRLRQVTQLGESGGRLVFVSATMRHPEEVSSCDWDGGSQRRHTGFNRTWSRKRPSPRVTVRGFEVPDGEGGTERVDAWLLRPPGEGPFPLLVDMHGGPQSAVLVDYASHVYWYELIAHGWMVLAPNAVGSAGYGAAFAQRLIGRWGELDLPQHLAILDTLRAEGLIDHRVACTGKSYGGFLAAWAVGHADEFRAAVVCAPVADLQSHAGTSDTGFYVTPYAMGGGVEDARDRYERLSPIHCATRVRAAMLLLQGQQDERCPLGQSEELFAKLALSSRGPLRMVVYPGGSHGLAGAGRPGHRVDFHRRIVDWIDRHAGQACDDGGRDRAHETHDANAAAS